MLKRITRIWLGYSRIEGVRWLGLVFFVVVLGLTIGATDIFFEKFIGEAHHFVSGAIIAYLAALFLKEYARTLEMAVIDPLTGIYNYNHLLQLFPRIVKRAIKEKNMILLCLLDVDKLKKINDSHGHDAGNELVKRLARSVLDNIRPQDVFVRYTKGDEFIVLTTVKNEDEANGFYMRIRSATESKAFAYNGEFMLASASVGLAIENASENLCLEGLVNEADKALYEIKKQRLG